MSEGLKRSNVKDGSVAALAVDLRLIERMGRRDEGALDLFYERYSGTFNGMAFQILGDGDLAAEAVQDLFVKIWRRAESYDPARSRPFTWCTMILRGICYDYLRKKSRRVVTCADEGVAEGVSAEGDSDVRGDVVQALEELDAEDRETVLAALLEAVSTRQLAERWAVPIGTAKSRIHRSMSRLRGILKTMNLLFL